MRFTGKRLQKMKDDTISRETELSTKDLLEYVISLASGDDYDGCFTEFGDWEFNYMKQKLFERLGTLGIK